MKKVGKIQKGLNNIIIGLHPSKEKDIRDVLVPNNSEWPNVH